MHRPHYRTIRIDTPYHVEPDEPPSLPTDEGTPTDDEPLAIWVMKMTQSAFREKMAYLTSQPPEAAGILIGPIQEDLLITHFLPDSGGKGTSASFEINASGLNQLLREIKPAGLTCQGIVHSHPHGMHQPSSGDLQYFRRLFARPANADTGHLFVPIVCSGRFFPYVFARDHVFAAELVLL